jgi:hypothetical protein
MASPRTDYRNQQDEPVVTDIAAKRARGVGMA